MRRSRSCPGLSWRWRLLRCFHLRPKARRRSTTDTAKVDPVFLADSAGGLFLQVAVSQALIHLADPLLDLRIIATPFHAALAVAEVVFRMEVADTEAINSWL